MSIISPEKALLGCVSSSAEYQQRSNIYNLVTLLKCCSFDHFLYWMKKKHHLMQQKNICSCQQLLHTLAQIVSTDLPITGGFQSFSIPSWQLTQYNIFDPQQLCQGRGGLNCQVWKVIVEDSQSVSQCFTAAQSY